MIDPMIEQLELRQLMTAVLNGRTLTITATSGNDVIFLPISSTVEFEPNGDIVHQKQITVMLNGQSEGDFTIAKFSQVTVDLRSGDDRFASGVSNGRRFRLTVIGGPGNDTIFGGVKSDKIDGGPGNDSMVGNAGGDLFISSEGSDTILGGNGVDRVDYSHRTGALQLSVDDVANDGEPALGEHGNVHSDIETLIGGAGADLISAQGRLVGDYMFIGNGGKNTLLGGNGNDTLIGGPKNDSLRGGPGSDFLEGHAGRDKLLGGSGIDQVIAGDDNERDTITGTLGEDTVNSDFLDVGNALPPVGS